MARKSTKENKNIYQCTREGLGLTCEEASDLLVTERMLDTGAIDQAQYEVYKKSKI